VTRARTRVGSAGDDFALETTNSTLSQTGALESVEAVRSGFNGVRTTGTESRANLGSFRRAPFEAHAGPSAVFVDELDAGGF
jgi:hypothetical protein